MAPPLISLTGRQEVRSKGSEERAYPKNVNLDRGRLPHQQSQSGLLPLRRVEVGRPPRVKCALGAALVTGAALVLWMPK
jgi:hypothetical protein